MSAHKKTKISEYFYLRDAWGKDGKGPYCRRAGEYKTIAEALKAARTLAKEIGKGAVVQVIHVLAAVRCEVRS